MAHLDPIENKTYTLIKNLKQFLDRPIPNQLRSCIVCHELNFSGDYICQNCLAVLRRFTPEHQGAVYGYPFPVYSLWSWHNLPHRPFYKIVRGLKQANQPELFSIMARRSVNQFLLRSPRWENPKQFLVVPSPSRRRDHCDHALSFSLAISKETGWEINDRSLARSAIDKSSIQEQKTLGRQGRFQRTIDCVKKFDTAAYGRIVFVDDVITTGATAKMAWIALGKPIHFEVWTILARAALPKSRATDIPLV